MEIYCISRTDIKDFYFDAILLIHLLSHSVVRDFILILGAVSITTMIAINYTTSSRS